MYPNEIGDIYVKIEHCARILIFQTLIFLRITIKLMKDKKNAFSLHSGLYFSSY